MIESLLHIHHLCHKKKSLTKIEPLTTVDLYHVIIRTSSTFTRPDAANT